MLRRTLSSRLEVTYLQEPLNLVTSTFTTHDLSNVVKRAGLEGPGASTPACCKPKSARPSRFITSTPTTCFFHLKPSTPCLPHSLTTRTRCVRKAPSPSCPTYLLISYRATESPSARGGRASPVIPTTEIRRIPKYRVSTYRPMVCMSTSASLVRRQVGMLRGGRGLTTEARQQHVRHCRIRLVRSWAILQIGRANV